ncbi:hypothetical protein NWI01_34250 [Nitrobacter winogradskyi]|uniref:Uncharacterized protein n=1 Tax=Nitrobacter winogradskyi TaxID=913 RepID=A0A4Y3WF65_NITWI|nr:hypothetical protein NWI01_34250 [Nitrobacter winogradskyi]
MPSNVPLTQGDVSLGLRQMTFKHRALVHWESLRLKVSKAVRFFAAAWLLGFSGEAYEIRRSFSIREKT